MNTDAACTVQRDPKDGQGLTCTGSSLGLDAALPLRCDTPAHWQLITRKDGEWGGHALCDAHRSLLTNATEVTP